MGELDSLTSLTKEEFGSKARIMTSIILRSHETVNKIDAQRAERLGIGHSFSNDDEFFR